MHGFANPTRFLRIARPLTPWLLGLGLALAGSALAWGLFVAPAERLQGDTVRILFIHVPSAWLGMAGWTAIAGASLAEIVWRHPLAAIAGRAAALPGAVFTALCLATGSLWGRANDKSWYREVAFGLPALREGKWWTPISSAFVEPGPWLYVIAFVAVVVGMGWAEWQLGTVKAVLVDSGQPVEYDQPLIVVA